MKRCPECEFLYEDEQDCCEMDGTRLRNTGFLPPLPLPQHVVKAQSKSIWSGLTIPLLVLVIVGSVLVILYRAAPPTFSSSAGLKKKPTTSEAVTPAESDSPPQLEPAPTPAESSNDQSSRRQSSSGSRNIESTMQKSMNGGLEIHFQVGPASPIDNSPKPATIKETPSQPTPPKAAASSSKISVQPEARPVSSPPQARPQTQNQDSKFKSLMKKAGRILKKPF